MTALQDDIRIIAFDVFGTVVDWHGSVMREVAELGLEVDGAEFALAWRAGYKPAMAEVMERGEWIILDTLHRRILDRVLDEFGLSALGEDERRHLNRAWHRLDPWPDAIEGLTRLASKYLVTTLSNGNIGLLADMAKRAGLPWDCILCAETFRKYRNRVHAQEQNEPKDELRHVSASLMPSGESTGNPAARLAHGRIGERKSNG